MSIDTAGSVVVVMMEWKHECVKIIQELDVLSPVRMVS
jgi:hypothetical protein